VKCVLLFYSFSLLCRLSGFGQSEEALFKIDANRSSLKTMKNTALTQRTQQLKSTDGYEIEGLTLAINDMPKMLKFYKNVFGINFTERNEFGTKLYSGKWANLSLLFCPAEVAQNKATQNKHQFDILVEDLNVWIKKCEENGGLIIGEVARQKNLFSVGVYDPDRNTIVLKQYK
jgi:predicted enzyme related to lactoylglutathione lyase